MEAEAAFISPGVFQAMGYFSRVVSLNLLAVAGVTTAIAASAPLRDPTIIAHFDIGALQQPENIKLEPDGSAVVTFNRARQVARVSTKGVVTILATLPAPASGTALATGIVRTKDGALYVNYSAGVLSSIWRIPPNGGLPSQFVALPDVAALNGLAIDESGSSLYVTDSSKGAVWNISLRPGMAGAVTLWAQGAQLQPTASSAIASNGIKVHNGAVWLSNTAQGTLMSIPINEDGTAGTITTKATGLTAIDDFAFTGSGDVVAAQNFVSEVSIVHQDGTHVTVLTSSDGLSNPTSIAIRGSTVYVASGAYFTHVDPNLMVAHLGYEREDSY
jgi:sugar lactone lactonase YvrE